MHHRLRSVVSTAVLYMTFVCVLSPPAAAQNEGDAITIGTWRTHTSERLGETRRLNIGLPSDYDTSDAFYPVLYLLDGPLHFHHTTGLTRFLAQEDVAPGIIVVAVGNTNRTRDMTPPTRDTDNPWAASAGGADDFITYFRDELIPFIDGEYRTHPYRVLVGHSFGGLFALHALIHEPDVFDAYLAISPSLWWDDQALVEQAESSFSATDDLNKTLYMTMGSEGGDMLGGMLKLQDVMTEYRPRGFEWRARVMNDETHTSTPYRSTQEGLQYIFRHWNMNNPMSRFDDGGLDAIYAASARAESRYGLERKPPSSTFTQLGWELIDAGRLDEAADVLDHDPDHVMPPPMLYVALAEAYEARGDEQGMIAAYTRALTRNPAADAVREKLVALGVDAEAVAPRPVPLTADALATLAGSYRDDDEGEIITITVVDGDLAMGGAAPPRTFKTLEADRFIADDQSTELVFVRDDQGHVVGFEVRRGSRTVGRASRDGVDGH